ncbi:MAG: GntR family transcriptional regulator [Clostridia bacterium]|nr:GntR family transcriptional regulator [Clostridia bacterium]
MFTINALSRTPVYEQIVDQIEKLISAGILKEGEQLPSVRSLSIQISVNPNTIQKAYGELDSRGITGSVPGRGCFVMPNARERIKSRAKEKLSALTALVEELLQAGVSREDIIKTVDSITSKKEESK